MLCDCVSSYAIILFCIPSFDVSFFLSLYLTMFSVFFYYFDHTTVQSLTDPYSSAQFPCLHEYECIFLCFIFYSHLSCNLYLVELCFAGCPSAMVYICRLPHSCWSINIFFADFHTAHFVFVHRVLSIQRL